jgi:hypothetical protein
VSQLGLELDSPSGGVRIAVVISEVILEPALRINQTRDSSIPADAVMAADDGQHE